MKLYPNPIMNNIIIESIDKKITSIIIFSINGDKLFYKDLNSSKNSIDISSLSSGVYILKVNMNNFYRTIKIIKK